MSAEIMDLDAEKIMSLLTEHRYLVGTLVAGVGILLLKRHLAGGVCRSKARLDGRTVIVTGANTGIGKETARDMARRGARVIIACRNMEKAETAAEEIRSDTGSKNVIIKKLDLSSLSSVREFSEDILKSEPRIDILINNAGVMHCPFSRTADGFEMQFGTNHLGHFYLTNLLLDKMKKSAPARIVNVSSSAHEMTSHLDLDKLNEEKGFSTYYAYADSKLLNVLFTRELNRRLKDTGVTTYSLHPGVIFTELSRHYSLFMRIVTRPLFWMIKDAKAGAQTSIYCAVEEGIESQSGKYFSDCAVKTESKLGRDDDLALRAWELSEKLIAQSQK